MKPWIQPSFYVALLATLAVGLLNYPRLIPHESIRHDVVELSVLVLTWLAASFKGMWNKPVAAPTDPGGGQ